MMVYFLTGIHNDNTIADRMCHHFANVGKDLVQSIVISEHEGSLKKYLLNASDVSAYLKPINASELSEKLKKLGKLELQALTFITVKILKYIYPVISGHLVYLFNECFRTGVFPSCFKIAKVIPVYKGRR